MTTISKTRLKSNVVIVSHAMNEAITHCILKNKPKLENVKVISLQEILSEFEVFDEINDRGTVISWIKDSKNTISNRDHYLLNRVLYVPKNLFKQFSAADREYAQRELEAYLGFSFNAFRGIGNQLATGRCVESLSLPQQWEKVNKAFMLNVPNYYWGPGIYNGLKDRCSLVYSQIYNFLNWSSKTTSYETEQVFCFEKPQGQPVFILTIGEKCLITSHLQLSETMELALQLLARKLSHFFRHFISEILIFVAGNSITFGCINPEIIKSVHNVNFNDLVCDNLMEEFYKCIN